MVSNLRESPAVNVTLYPAVPMSSWVRVIAPIVPTLLTLIVSRPTPLVLIVQLYCAAGVGVGEEDGEAVGKVPLFALTIQVYVPDPPREGMSTFKLP